jgi:hypothetical protein
MSRKECRDIYGLINTGMLYESFIAGRRRAKTPRICGTPEALWKNRMGRKIMADPKAPALPNVRDAFDEAVSVFIAWNRHGGAEPTVSFNDVPVPISRVAALAEAIKDPMPASVFWRMVTYANRFVDECRTEAVELSRDGSFETGARCLRKWVQNSKKRFGQ